MIELASALESAVLAVDREFECDVLGSYRREVAFSSDIDFVIRHRSLRDTGNEAEYKEMSKGLLVRVVAELEKRKLIDDADRLTNGDKKYSVSPSLDFPFLASGWVLIFFLSLQGLVKLSGHTHKRRIDIRIAPYDSYPYMQFSTTGDALLMKLTRHVAKNKGYTLNEYGMGKKWDKDDLVHPPPSPSLSDGQHWESDYSFIYLIRTPTDTDRERSLRSRTRRRSSSSSACRS